jgi:outer membrane protein assembly factor BamA
MLRKESRAIMNERIANKTGWGKKLLLAVTAIAGVLGAVSIVTAGPAPRRGQSKFVLSDLKIEGDVHDRDEVRGRILNAWKGRDYYDLKDLTDEVMESGLRKDFQDRGYFKVVVDKPVTKALQTVDGRQHILLLASVAEGNQFRVGKFAIENEVAGQPLNIPEATLREQFHLRQGDLFKVSEVRAGLERLKSLYGAKGYSDAKEQPDTAIDDAHHVIDITVRIAEGPRAR